MLATSPPTLVTKPPPPKLDLSRLSPVLVSTQSFPPDAGDRLELPLDQICPPTLTSPPPPLS
ncbi:hypothetical protein TIFTF001_010231 [Ficus carica]|uniref:Uncharacterized protein n=1 Tax=Ficus carica TaxID=3494 RepID=A0AA87ZRD0_FICCA|nr:hypothetical protein TIFTF001_010231 [Ficus carica]